MINILPCEPFGQHAPQRLRRGKPGGAIRLQKNKSEIFSRKGCFAEIFPKYFRLSEIVRPPLTLHFGLFSSDALGIKVGQKSSSGE
jgi:hypothetical protein